MVKRRITPLTLLDLKIDAEKVVSELKQKSQYVEWNKEKRKEYYAVFARSFKHKPKDLLLFDLSDINNWLTLD